MKVEVITHTKEQFEVALPSEIILMALDDLELVEKDPRYDIDMNYYHYQVQRGKATCAVCFAGAVIAKTLEQPIDKDLVASDLTNNRAIMKRIYALNAFRMGQVASGLREMGMSTKSLPLPQVGVTPYFVSPERFKVDMRNIAKGLAGLGM